MIGGLLKSTSKYAILAAAGVLVCGVSAPAKAADLGGDCCADLEERVAELEATTVRKGNKKVSVTLNGQVNRSLMWYDDGKHSDVIAVDNTNSSTRFRLLGSAKIRANLSAGFFIEVQMQSARSIAVDQINHRRPHNVLVDQIAVDAVAISASGGDGFLNVRHMYWWIKHDQLGQLSVGQLSPATKDLAFIDLGDIGAVGLAQLNVGNGLFVRRSDLPGNTSLQNFRVGSLQSFDDPLRMDGVRYDSPTFVGFTASAAWGENDYWDVALRYANEFNGLRVAAGIGYSVDLDEVNVGTPPFADTGRRERESWLGSISVWHVPTGLFANAGFAHREFKGSGYDACTAVITAACPQGAASQKPDQDLWYIQAGIKKNFFGIGYTSIYGEYVEYNGAADGGAANLGAGFNFTQVTDSQLSYWGVGIVQQIDAAAMELYLGYRNHEISISGVQGAGAAPGPTLTAPLTDISIVHAGARIKF